VLILGKHLVKVEIKNPIVFGVISLHQCRVGGRGNLAVMSNFNPMEMKFGMKVEFDTLYNFPKFGRSQLISGLAPTHIKKFWSYFMLVNAITVAVIDQNS